MKSITFADTPEERRHFELLMLAVQTPHYEFKSREELRNHGKLMTAIEGISVPNENTEGQRLLCDGPQTLVLDDAWLQLAIRMATPPNTRWFAHGSKGKTTRHVEAMFEFFAKAKDYVAPKKEPAAPVELQTAPPASPADEG